MSQRDIDEAVARITGESLLKIRHLGFDLADPFEPHFDPEPRWPLYFDWDAGAAIEWPEL